MVELTRHGSMTRHRSAGEVEKCENVSGDHSSPPNGESIDAGKPRSPAGFEQALLVPSSILCVAHLETKPSTDLRR
jgi:hypothetical protein